MPDRNLFARPCTDEAARARLAQEFPRLAPRIVAAVFDAYRRVTPTPERAAVAAHERLRDACTAV